MALEKKPDFKAIETKWQDWWIKNKIYKFNPKSKKKIYSVDVPPITPSGKMHVGHALHYTQFEYIARYRRMAGFETFFPACFDDNGLPTERYVEEKYGLSKAKVERYKWRKLCFDEATKLIKEYTKVLAALGYSWDYSIVYRTINNWCQKQSQRSFIDLYNKGELFRKKEPTIWCPYHQTALAQAEVEDKKRVTNLNYVKFKVNNKFITIATTRPELLPACVAVFVHPDDKRYKKLIGKKAIVPLFNYKIPIMKDENVDPEFGTGILMVCTFGDNADIEKWKRYKLPLKIAITKDGKLNNLAGKYKGDSLESAKNRILKDLKAKKLLTKQEEIEQTVGTCWRCHAPVEYIVTKQWIVNTLKHKKKLIALGRKIKWFPAYYRKRYENWIENLAWDWTISRQRYFGIPFPIWYCKKCNEVILPDDKDLPVDPIKTKPKKSCKCGSKKVIPEYDVLDTWMTSSISPLINTKWKKDSKFFKKMFPLNLRPQGHDIIRTWTFYTILKSYLHLGKTPWKDIMMSGHGLDSKGKKMSKSVGNIIEPLAMITKYNGDALRYWAAIASVGEDLPFQEKDLARGMRILIKLWNTARFVEMHLKKVPRKAKLSVIDKWILSRLSETIENYHKYFKNYQPSKARKEIEMFFLHEFCDFYLEMIKYRLYGKSQDKAAKYTIYHCLLAILKLWAPIIPHITEEIYQELFKKHEKDKSIHISKFPKPITKDKRALALGKLAVQAIAKLRKYKADKNMSLGKEIEELTLRHPKPSELKKIADDIKGTMRIKELKFKKGPLKVL